MLDGQVSSAVAHKNTSKCTLRHWSSNAVQVPALSQPDSCSQFERNNVATAAASPPAAHAPETHGGHAGAAASAAERVIRRQKCCWQCCFSTLPTYILV